MESDEDSSEFEVDATCQKSSLPNIKLTKDQYKVILRLAQNDKFAALPPKWLAKHPFPKWSILTKGTGKRFYWGLCWEWAGPLKFGLIAEGYERVDELYSIISNVVEQLKSPWHSEKKKKPLSEYSKRHHPYTFLIFTHTGNDMFQVTCSRILREHCDTLVGAKMVTGWLDQRNTLDVTTSLDTAYTHRLHKLKPETTTGVSSASCDQEQPSVDSDNESVEF